LVQPLSGLPTGSAPQAADDAIEERNLLITAFTYRTYSYRETLFSEFERLVEEGKQFDGLIIDLIQIGYSLPLESMIKFNNYAKRLLKPGGVLLFIKPDGAVTLTRDDPAGGLTFNVYDSPFGIFARYPMLADYVCATVSGIDRRRLRGGGSTLANHILYTSIPVLTERGSQVKGLFEIPPPQNWLLQYIDDYSSVEAISRALEKQYQVPPDEVLRLLQELESEKLIFPIFSRLQFLSSCYHNRKPFRLGRYMLAAGIVSPSQLQELLEEQQEEGWGRSQKTYLGLLAVRHGYLNTRELEVLLNDQYLYGGYHRIAEDDDANKNVNLETVKDSMIGSLGAIDAAGLLQSLSTAKKTGLLTVENRNTTLSVLFSEGKPTHARMNKLTGHNALAEFLICWTEGIFVFKDRGASPDIDPTCALNMPLDKTLLDAALFQDQTNQIISELSGGRSAILERAWNFEGLWSALDLQRLHYYDGTPVPQTDQAFILSLAGTIDGLSTLEEVLTSFDLWPKHMIVRAIKMLVDQKLVSIQEVSLFRPLSIFQQISTELEKEIGPADNKGMLESSLHYVHGNSPAASRFNVDHEGRVSIDLNEVKNTSTPVSRVLLELRRWMEAYLAYARRQVEPSKVNDLIVRVIYGDRA
jgi:hypothetical protein